MFRHILLPTDGSQRSLRAIRAGLELAKRADARVTGLLIVEQTYVPEVDGDVTPLATRVLSEAAAMAQELGLVCECVQLRSSTPQDGIVRFAQEKGCDLIVMGTHGRSRVGKFFLGSVAASVLGDCDIPVLLYR
jgi:nucleotide-binding universal stress UspA family protein